VEGSGVVGWRWVEGRGVVGWVDRRFKYAMSFECTDGGKEKDSRQVGARTGLDEEGKADIA
jgi:hypothetical protein